MRLDGCRREAARVVVADLFLALPFVALCVLTLLFNRN